MAQQPSSYLYTADSVEYLLERYYQARRALDLVEHFLDIDRALGWLKARQPLLFTVVIAWAQGMTEKEMAHLHHIPEEDVARYLTFIFGEMARFLNAEPTFL